jgi:hypothetical protein
MGDAPFAPSEYAIFSEWFKKRWPEFDNSDSSAYECWLQGRKAAFEQVRRTGEIPWVPSLYDGPNACSPTSDQ